MILVVAPLVVSVIVRTYGWQLLLGNSATGGLNWLLGALGLGKAPVQVLYTEWAIVIASVHVFLPLMVLPLSASLSRINPSLVEAARMLGAPAWRAFLRITLPLAWPGILAGSLLAFARAMGEFGASLMVAGSIPQQTQTASMAIYDAVQSGNDDTALWLVLLTSALAMAVLMLSRRLFSRA